MKQTRSLVALALFSGFVPLLADEKPTPKTAEPAAELAAPTADDLADPAFERYVDLRLLGYGWEQLDAGLLTDVALQLAEGERVLQRPHNFISADALFEVAVKMATDKRDQKTLDRLAKVLGARQNGALVAQINSAKKLGGASRKTDPAPSVSIAEMKPEQLVLYQQTMKAIQAAGVQGDTKQLTDLEAELKNDKGSMAVLSPTQRTSLQQLVEQTRSSAESSASGPVAGTLEKLRQASRGEFSFRIGVPPRPPINDPFGRPNRPFNPYNPPHIPPYIPPYNPPIYDSGTQLTNLVYDPRTGRYIARTERETVRESALDPNRDVVDRGSMRRVDRIEFDRFGNRVRVTGQEWTSFGVPHSNLTRTTIRQNQDGDIIEEQHHAARSAAPPESSGPGEFTPSRRP